MITSTSNGHLLEFKENPYHVYLLDGVKVDSVTTIAKGGLPTSFRLIGWMVGIGVDACIELLKLFPEQVGKLPTYVLEEVAKVAKGASKKKAKEAADIGTLVHDFVDLSESGQDTIPLENVIDKHKDADKIHSCLTKFKEWRKDNKDTVIKHEEICASSKYQLAGKFDRLANRRGKIVLSDWKTSSGIYTDQLIQLALYSILIEEWLGIVVDAIEIVRFGKEDGEFEVKIISDPFQLADLEIQALRNIGTVQFMKKWEK